MDIGSRKTKWQRCGIRTLQFERLDQRITLDATASAAAALPWFDPAELTYSFAPDGTRFGNERSSLFAELAPTGSELEWQGEFAKAFDQWLSILATSITFKSDSGADFGTFGPTQGDERFGDIRIGAVPLSENVMAEAVPHSVITQGSWAGDILLNSNADWTDLQHVYSVALHEIGHVMGLGHSDDPQSPMFFHGVYDATGPTTSDAAKLSKLYAGIDLQVDHDESPHEPGEQGEWRDEPNFEFDIQQAVPLTATLSSSARYSASGALTTESTSVLYQLQTIGEIDHAEFLNIVVSAKQRDGLIPRVVVYDHAGDPIPTQILHNSEGVVVIQARDVEPNHSYFVAVSSAAAAPQYQIGEFALFAEYSLSKLVPTQIGAFSLTAERPIVEQQFNVRSSRLVHLLVSSDSRNGRSQNNAVWGTLVDARQQVIARLAMNQGDSRSAPLVFLEPGDYTLILETGTRDGNPPAAAILRVFVDEISIDIGIGIVDPATQPIVSCAAVGIADPNNCIDPEPIILIELPVFPDPITLPLDPYYPSLPPWDDPSWLYWPELGTTSPPVLPLHNSINAMDVSGDGIVSPLDVLLIVNALNFASISGPTYFLDTSGDRLVSALDALLVVNHLNSHTDAHGEGESAVPNDELSVEFMSAFEDEELRRWRRL